MASPQGSSSNAAESGGDPFDESLSELRQIISSARSIASNAATRGVVTRELVDALSSNMEEGASMLRTLQDVLQSIREGRLRGSAEAAAPLPHGSTWIQREAAVVNVANELYDVSHAAKKLIDVFEKHHPSRRGANKRQGGVTVDVGAEDDDSGPSHGDFLRAHHEEQQSMMESQDQSLSRIQHGLEHLKHNATEMHNEMDRQEAMLVDVQGRVDMLKEKMAAANKKVDHLLENMSDCKKICIIVVLCFVLGFLTFAVL
jgi:hypothetical protein